MIQHIHTDQEFYKVLQQPNLIVVDFFATWCGPCKAVAPQFEQLSKEFTDVTFAKVDTDKLPAVAQSQGIKAMPTFMVYLGGQTQQVIQGANIPKLRSTIESLRSKAGTRKGPTNILPLNCDLEQLYIGFCKKVILTRKRVVEGKMIDERKELQVQLQPGWKAGTKITFEGEGDESVNVSPGDIVFEVKERKHARFVRDGDNLLLKQSITLEEALCGGNMYVLGIDGKNIAIDHDNEVLNVGTVKVVKGAGMPIKKTGEFGDLIVTIDRIEMPTSVNEEQREAIKALNLM